MLLTFENAIAKLIDETRSENIKSRDEPNKQQQLREYLRLLSILNNELSPVYPLVTDEISRITIHTGELPRPQITIRFKEDSNLPRIADLMEKHTQIEWDKQINSKTNRPGHNLYFAKWSEGAGILLRDGEYEGSLGLGNTSFI